MRRRVGALCSSVLLAVVFTATVAARPAAAANNTGNDLSPIFECAFKLPDGSYQSAWGYDNETGAVKTFQAGGDQNRFTPSPGDRGQPSTFQLGRHDNVVVVPWDGRVNLKYHLDNGNAKATVAPACANNPVPITGSGLSSVAAVVVLALIAFAIDHHIRRRRRRPTRSAR